MSLEMTGPGYGRIAEIEDFHLLDEEIRIAIERENLVLKGRGRHVDCVLHRRGFDPSAPMTPEGYGWIMLTQKLEPENLSRPDILVWTPVWYYRSRENEESEQTSHTITKFG